LIGGVAAAVRSELVLDIRLRNTGTRICSELADQKVRAQDRRVVSHAPIQDSLIHYQATIALECSQLATDTKFAFSWSCFSHSPTTCGQTASVWTEQKMSEGQLRAAQRKTHVFDD
jgi:hypothetical protein